jgi:hypothetical protein
MQNPLRDKIDNWRKIDVSNNILEWIDRGVPLQFADSKLLPPYNSHNNKFSKEERIFIRRELNGLIAKSVVQKVPSRPWCVSPIKCVPKKNNKLRLITDLRFVNSFIQPPKFQLDGVNTVAEYVEANDKFISLDLKDGFFHIPVHADYWKYLGFSFENEYYVWCVLPFGLCCSPYYFHKVLRPVITFIRSQNIRCSIYVDDCLVAAPDLYICDHRDFVIDTFEDLGFTVNYNKSCLTPCTTISYIGYIIESQSSDGRPWLSMTHAKVTKLKKDISRCLAVGYIGARQLAKIAGQAISMSRAILPGKLKLRSLYALLGSKKSWSDTLNLTVDCAKDLRWWLNHIDSWNGSPLRLPPVDTQIWTDASGSGWGCVLNNSFASGTWDPWAYSQHINYKELLTVLLALRSFGDRVRGQHLQVLTDSVTAAAYINNMGGPIQNLSELSEVIWTEVLAKNLIISCKHIRGVTNTTADMLSRLSTQYEWKLNPYYFQVIDQMWGPHTIDRFASYSTAQLPRYNSRFLDPATVGVDALAQTNWCKENNFVNPPFRLLDKVLDLVIRQKAWATIIAPKWTGQIWYQKLRSVLMCPPLRIHMNRRTMTQMGSIAEPTKNPRWKIFAWRIYGGKDSQH